MNNGISRGRLLAGGALGLGLALAPQSAQAACNAVTATGPGVDTYVCVSNTTTTDTTYPTNVPNDRNVDYGAAIPIFLDVESGVLVDGYGLSMRNIAAGTQPLTVTNDGTIQVNAGLTPTAGGNDAALNLTAIDNAILYGGTGDIINLGTGEGLGVLITGAGSLTANIGGSVRADAGDAIQVVSTNAAGGAIGITTTAGETIRASGGDGIDIDTAGGGNVGVINAAAISSGGAGFDTLQDGINVTSAGTGDITINNSGAIGATGDEAQLTGITAAITNAASAGDISVAGTGDIFSVGNGIDVSTLGTGAASVVYGGDVTSTTGNAVEVDTTTGAITLATGGVLTADAGSGIVTTSTTGNQAITVTGGSVTGDVDGINATATTGTIGVTLSGGADVTGTVSGIDVASTGAQTITVGTGSVVTGGTQAILLAGTGTATVSNSGTIGAAASPGGLAINAAAAGATGVTNNAGGTINGRLTLSAFNDTFSNSGLWNTQGITDFGVGMDALTNNAAGTINLTGNTTLANLETFTQNGRINLNTFVLTGPPIAFTNNGTIDTNGNAGLGGFTSFNNAGTLDLAAGTFTVPAAVFTNSGTILADEGATTITGQTSFANSGTLDLQDGVPNDVLTINSNFVGSGGSNLDIDFSGSASDRLVINGAASGTTAVDAAYLGGGFNLDGLLVVDTVSSSANAFVLGSVTGETPLLAVDLEQRGADYFLVAAPTAAAFNPLVVPGFATDLWYQSADEIFAETVKPATTSGISFWGEGYISRDKYGDDDDTVVVDGVAFDVDNEVKTKRHGLQMGVDYGFGGGRIGLTGGYAWAKANGNADADLKAKGWNLGIYGQFGGLTGFHGEFLAKHDRYKAKFTDGAFDDEKFDIRATGIDGSLGYRFGMGGAMTMDIHGGLSHVRTKVDDINAFGFNYDIAKLTSTRGRAGVRAILGGGMAPYVDATVYREFKGGGDVELFDGFNAYDLDTRGKGTWVRLEAGLSGNDGPGPILAAWGDLGDRKGIGLRAGWKLGGRVAEALPPPPPMVSAPPPPPPPATQTCPDGSVILATDMCPPPPPPPPPPPEPERG